MMTRALFKPVLAVGLAAAALGAAAPAAASPNDDLKLFLSLLEGEFNNAAQAAAESGANGGSEPLPEAERHPWHHHSIRRIEAPAVGDHVFAARILEEGPQGGLVRARVYVVDADPSRAAVLVRFFGLEPAAAPDGGLDPDRLAGLVPESLRAYPEGCRVVWQRRGEGFTGEIARGDCRVPSPRSGRAVVIAARMELDPARLRHLEEGFDENLEPLFSAPGGLPFELDRVPAG
jgi:hypothetical protein